MTQSSAEDSAQFYAQTYDASVADWPGEIDFYRALARTAHEQGNDVLELGCGTGRVALRLAQEGVRVVGLDRSPAMLNVARARSAGFANVEWLEGDMRSFELARSFGLVIIPGHSFQNILTAQDQIACLRAVKRHLLAVGVLVIHLDHQDVDWLGEIMGKKRGVFEPAEEFDHPATGRRIRASRAWSYERSTQTAIVQTMWDEIDAQGGIVSRVERGPVRLHCVFPFEMAHLLALAGYEIAGVYGDFFRAELSDASAEMIWVAVNGESGLA